MKDANEAKGEKRVRYFVVITGDLHHFIAGYGGQRNTTMRTFRMRRPYRSTRRRPRAAPQDRAGCAYGRFGDSSNIVEIATFGQGNETSPAIPGTVRGGETCSPSRRRLPILTSRTSIRPSRLHIIECSPRSLPAP